MSLQFWFANSPSSRKRPKIALPLNDTRRCGREGLVFYDLIVIEAEVVITWLFKMIAVYICSFDIYRKVTTNGCVCIQDHLQVLLCSALEYRGNCCRRQQRYKRRKWWDEKTLAERSCMLSCGCDAPSDRKMWKANNKRPLTYLASSNWSSLLNCLGTSDSSAGTQFTWDRWIVSVA